MDLLGLDEVARGPRVAGQSYLGVRGIPVDRIVGSLDRTADFDRNFRPRRGLSRSRLASLSAAFPDGAGMPAIEVHEVGGACFVADGHHRVALARERRVDFSDAEITRLETNYEIGPDVAVCALVQTEQQLVSARRAASPAPTGTTTSTGRASRRCGARRCPRCTPTGPTRTCSCGCTGDCAR